VLHRIVRRDGDRFVTKGDNNTFLDPDHPGTGDILGSKWLLVPQGGTVVAWLRRHPPYAGLIAAALGLVMGGGLSANAARSRRRRSGSRVRPSVRRRPLPIALGAPQAFAVALTAALLFLAFIAVAYTRPTTTAGKVPYTQRGQFDYAAGVPAGPVYEQPRLTTGDPIFLRLVPRLDVSFDYSFTTTGRHKVGGTATMRVELAATSGWTGSLPTATATTFEGDHTRLGSSIDPAQIRAIIAQVETATGVPGGTYTVRIIPDVHVAGTLAGQRVTDQFSSPLAFRLEPNQLVPQEPSTVQAAKTATVSVPGAHRGRFVVLGVAIDVALARRVSMIGAALSLLAALIAAAVATRGTSGERARIQARYGRWLIPVESWNDRPKGHTVEVATIDALVRLAERYDRMVLVRHDDAVGDAYVVDDGGIQFLYRAGGGPPSHEGRHSMNGDPAAGSPSGNGVPGQPSTLPLRERGQQARM
jgi:hypothetical protein